MKNRSLTPVTSALLVGLALTLAACGSSGSAVAGSAAPTSAPASASSAAAAANSPGSAPASPAGSAGSAASSSSAGGKAKVTGTVTLYGALTSANGQAFAKAFEAAQPGAKLQVVAAGSGALLSRIAAESRAGGVKADVILLADPTAMNGLVTDGILASYEPPTVGQLPQSLRGKGWNGAFTFNNVILYHRGLASPPKDWKDLNNAAYQGKVEIGDPAYSGTTLAFAGALSQKYGWTYFRSLRKIGARVVQSTNTVGTDVASGQMEAGVSLDVVGRDLMAKGSPLSMVWPASGSISVPAPVALVKGHETPAAKAFVDWLLSAAGQKEVVKLGYAPAYGASAAVPSGTKFIPVNWIQLGQNRDRILSTFKSIFG